MKQLQPADLQKMNAIIEYGMFHHILTLMVDFCLRHQKTEAVEKIKQWMLEVDRSLDYQEKQELQTAISQLFQDKCKDFLRELRKNFSSQEIQTILSQLAFQKP